MVSGAHSSFHMQNWDAKAWTLSRLFRTEKSFVPMPAYFQEMAASFVDWGRVFCCGNAPS